MSRDGDGYALAPQLRDLSDAERLDLVRRCDDAVAAYKTKRGAAIWEHRAIGLGRSVVASNAVAVAIHDRHPV